MDKLEIIKSLGGACIGLLATVVTFFFKGNSNKRSKNKAYNMLKITKVLLPLMIEAEKFINYSSKEKKEYVLTKVSRFSLENNIEYDEELISSKVEELIEFSNKINVSDSKKTNEDEINLFKNWL